MSAAPPSDLLAELRALRAGQDEVLAELRALRAALGGGAPTEADVALVHAIRDEVGDALFAAAEVIERARLLRASSALARALLDRLGSLNAKKLGHFLKRVEGADCAGLLVERTGLERGAAVWRVLKIQNPRSSSAARAAGA